ncbi:MAG: hypothetical protein OH316_00550 [Candidatus Parvarchaeota archaeon]|nr:hypothetical protein [Candidatus Parvarchaeota archaeon]
MGTNFKDDLKRFGRSVSRGVYSGLKSSANLAYDKLYDKLIEEPKNTAREAGRLEDILAEDGASIILPSMVKYDDKVTPNSIWANPDVLGRIHVDEGDAVLLLEEITYGNEKYYPLRGPFKVETHERIGPSYIFMNSSNSPYGGSYVEIINPMYAAGEFRGKIVGYYPLEKIYKSRGPGIVPLSYAKKIADSHNFLRPKEGTIVPVMTYDDNGNVNGIYQAEVSSLGNKFQIPTDINLKNVNSVGVHLGFSSILVRNKLL